MRAALLACLLLGACACPTRTLPPNCPPPGPAATLEWERVQPGEFPAMDEWIARLGRYCGWGRK